jgi:hypothetical protein
VNLDLPFLAAPNSASTRMRENEAAHCARREEIAAAEAKLKMESKQA